MNYIPVLGVALAAIAFWIISVQRSFASTDERIRNAMAQIGLQMQSQGEALICLLELINGYAALECKTIRKTMMAVIPITRDSSSEDVKRQGKIIAEVMTKITDVAQKYPKVKEDRTYVRNMDAVHQYGNMLQTSRLIYNDSAEKLNHAIRRFPASVIAGFLGFSNRGCFEEFAFTKENLKK